MINNISKHVNKLVIILLVLLLLHTTISCKRDKSNKVISDVYPLNDNYYQILVRSYADSNNDGIGDFNGITKRLPYLKDLGITGLWLMPINPSPTYHGYDVLDYYDVEDDYGSLDDFKTLCTEANKLGIKIMLDLVINHTSDKHPWFIKALNDDPVYKDYYVFAKSPTTGIMGSWGQNIWHTLNGKKYCGYFSNTMPDLNYDSELVQQEIINIGTFWANLGVSGFRIDAAQHLFGTGEYLGYLAKDLVELNIRYLNKFNTEMKKVKKDFFVIGEVNLTTESIVREYFRGLDSPLDFPVASKIMQTASSAASTTYVRNVKRIYDKYREINVDFISTPFLRNHDENRLANELSGNMDKMRLAAEMLLTLPGSPIIYYGEEIGMYGSKSNGEKSGGIDIWDETRRLPFMYGDSTTPTWFSDRNFADVVKNEQVKPALSQLEDKTSLLNTYKKLLNLRLNHISLRYGNDITLYEGNTNYVQGFYREFSYDKQYEKLLIVHNISNKEQSISLSGGTVIYNSNTDDYSFTTTIKPKSTIIYKVN